MDRNSNPKARHHRQHRRVGAASLGPAAGAVLTVALIPVATAWVARAATQSDTPDESISLNFTHIDTAATQSDTPDESISLNFTPEETAATQSDTPDESISLNFTPEETAATQSDTPEESLSLNFTPEETAATQSDTPEESLSLNFTHIDTAATQSDTPEESVSLNFTHIDTAATESDIPTESFRLNFASYLYNASDVTNGVPDPGATPVQSMELDSDVQYWFSPLLGWSNTEFTVAHLDASLPSGANAPGPGSVYDIFNLGHGWGNVYIDVVGASASDQTIHDVLVTPFGNLDLGWLFGSLFAGSGFDAMTTNLPGLEAFL